MRSRILSVIPLALLLTCFDQCLGSEPGDKCAIRPNDFSPLTVKLRDKTVALVAKDWLAWRELTKLKRAKDLDGIGRLVADKQVWTIESAEALILEDNTRRGDEFESYEVRITSGEHKGEKAYVAGPNLVRLASVKEQQAVERANALRKPNSAEADKLLRTWVCYHLAVSGVELQEAKPTVWRFGESTLNMEEAGIGKHMRWDADTSKIPYQINIKPVETESPLTRGIFKIEGDELVVCIPSEASDRPTAFVSQKEGATILMKFRRR